MENQGLQASLAVKVIINIYLDKYIKYIFTCNNYR